MANAIQDRMAQKRPIRDIEDLATVVPMNDGPGGKKQKITEQFKDLDLLFDVSEEGMSLIYCIFI